MEITIEEKGTHELGRIILLRCENRQLEALIMKNAPETEEEALEGFKKQLIALVEQDRRLTEPSPSEAPGVPERTKKSGCCGGKKKFGILSFLEAKLGGRVPLRVARQRLDICITCAEVDAQGQRLFREVEGVVVCGQPRLENIYRDEKAEGCGCNLRDKVKYKKASCPHEKWGPV